MIDQKLNLPRFAPVMVLPGAVLFPQAILPLMIFEPRYCAMLAEALDQQRMFCVAQLRPELSDWSSTNDFQHIAGVGLIRACVAHDDGTSHLVLQGLARVEFIGFSQAEPFVVAEIRALRSREAGSQLSVVSELRSYCQPFVEKAGGATPEFARELAEATNAGDLCDLLANALLREPAHRQEVLESSELADRMVVLLRHLQAEQND